ATGNGNNIIVDFGTLILSGAGTLNNTLTTGQAITVQSGGTLTLDNTATVTTDRIATPTTINLNNGRLRFIGNASAAATETLGTVNLTAGFGNVIQSDRDNNNNVLTITTLTRNAAASVRVVAGNAGAGTLTANQQVNAILVRGNNLTLANGGAFTLTVGNGNVGTLATSGTNNKIFASVDFAAQEGVVLVNAGGTLEIAGAVGGTNANSLN